MRMEQIEQARPVQDPQGVAVAADRQSAAHASIDSGSFMLPVVAAAASATGALAVSEVLAAVSVVSLAVRSGWLTPSAAGSCDLAELAAVVSLVAVSDRAAVVAADASISALVASIPTLKDTS